MGLSGLSLAIDIERERKKEEKPVHLPLPRCSVVLSLPRYSSRYWPFLPARCLFKRALLFELTILKV